MKSFSTFKGLLSKERTKNTGDTEPYPGTFNGFLDIVNPSGFANSFHHIYRQYLKNLRHLRNKSRNLAEDGPLIPLIISDRKVESKFFDKIESELHSKDEKVHAAPCFVGNECENIDMWSQITTTRRLWLEDDKSQKSTNINDDTSTKSLLVALFSNSTEDLLSNPSNQDENEQAGSGRTEIESKHSQSEMPEQRTGIHERKTESAVQSRILPLLNLHNYSDVKTPSPLPNTLNEGDAHTDKYISGDNYKIPSSNGLKGYEDVQTNNNIETQETFWMPTEAADSMVSNEKPVIFFLNLNLLNFSNGLVYLPFLEQSIRDY